MSARLAVVMRLLSGLEGSTVLLELKGEGGARRHVHGVRGPSKGAATPRGGV